MSRSVDIPVSSKAFNSIRDMDLSVLESLSVTELRPFLPCLVRMALCQPLDSSEEWIERKKKILQKLSESEMVDSIVSLLSVDFHTLDQEVKKELMSRNKIAAPHESILLSSLTDGLALEFERSDGDVGKKFRLVLGELFSLQSVPRPGHPVGNLVQARHSDLFDNDVYLEEIADVLSIAAAELPSSLPVVELAEWLLNVKSGPFLICRLAANFSELFIEICSQLVMCGEKQDEESVAGKTRFQTLRALCRMNPEKALLVRSMAVNSSKMPSLTLFLSLDQLALKRITHQDIILFLNGILTGHDPSISLWFSQFVKNGQKKMDQLQITSLLDLRRYLVKRLEFQCRSVKEESRTESNVIESSSLLRLYSAFRSMATIKFTDEEHSLLLELITSYPPVTLAGIKLLSLSLCMLISCPSLISSSDSEKKTINWLRRIVHEEKYFGPECSVKSSFGEMLLLMAIHFHSGQVTPISDLISSAFGFKLQVRTTTLTKIKHMFTHDIFPEETVAAHSVKVPVTPFLSSNFTGFLPIHCIHQLLRSRTFSKHRVLIKDWIFQQICNSSAPLHSVVLSLIESFVSSIIVPSTKSGHSTPHISSPATNDPICETDLMSVFRHKLYAEEEEEEEEASEEMEVDGEEKPLMSCLLTTQLLLLYYVLLFNDVRLSHTRQSGSDRIKKYSPELMSKIPVFFLVQEARRDEAKYGSLLPHLLRLTSFHFPYLCLVQDWMKVQNSSNRHAMDTETLSASNRINIPTLKNQLRKSFQDWPVSVSMAGTVLDQLLQVPRKKLWNVEPTFISILPKLLISGTTKTILNKCKKIWWRLNCIFPDYLWVQTVNIFRPPSMFGLKSSNLTWDEIVMDPLHVIRCDERVFRCPEIMEITLHMLNAFLAASRTFLSHHLLEKPSRNETEDKERDELKVALIAAQESAAIQILLEACLETDSDHSVLSDMKEVQNMKEQNLKEVQNMKEQNLKEVQGLVCKHLHQVFILDPNLAKLVHFQTYPRELLSLTVSTIPSMHICLDFLPELLSQPDLKKQIFAIELCSHLSLHFRIAKCLSTAKLCFNVSSTLLSVLSGDKRSSFFIPIIPSLVRMCRPFPPLTDDAILLFQQLQQISVSKLAATSPKFISFTCLKRKYLSIKSRYKDSTHFNKFISCLPEDEALCLIILHSFDSLQSLPESSRNVSTPVTLGDEIVLK